MDECLIFYLVFYPNTMDNRMGDPIPLSEAKHCFLAKWKETTPIYGDYRIWEPKRLLNHPLGNITWKGA